MTRPDELFPGIYRYCAQDAGRTRLLSGLAGALALCLATGYFVAHTTASWRSFLDAITFMQFNMLVFYATLCTARSVTQERADRTWDFQRLTPLSSLRQAAGKFLGAPVFPWFLFAAMTPAALAAAFAPDLAGHFLARYALGLSCSLFFIAAGLLASSYDDTGAGGLGFMSGPLIGLAGVSTLNAAFRYHAALSSPYASPISFYGLEMGGNCAVLFMTAGFLAFAAWAFLGARYRIGRDLLERRRLWRLPAFLFFLAWFAAGFDIHDALKPPHLPLSALLLPCVAVYLSGILSREGREYWRRWLAAGRAAARYDDAPAWLKGAVPVFLIAAVLAALNFSTGLFGPPDAGWRIFAILPLFLLRDMMFLQWCRFSASRRPEMMALIYIALAYALPGLILGPAGLKAALPYFLPYVGEGIGAAANLAGALAQALIMGFFLYKKIRPAVSGA